MAKWRSSNTDDYYDFAEAEYQAWYTSLDLPLSTSMDEEETNEEERQRQHDMEIAAKIAITADEQEPPSTNSSNDAPSEEDFQGRCGAAYVEKLLLSTRGQRVKEQRQRNTRNPPSNDDEEERSSDLPSVIAVLEQEEVALPDELSMSQSIPLVLANLVRENGADLSAEATEQRLQKILDMLLEMQNQQYGALSRQHQQEPTTTFGMPNQQYQQRMSDITEPTASLTMSSSEQTTSLTSSERDDGMDRVSSPNNSRRSTTTRRPFKDPPACRLFVEEDEQYEEDRKPAAKPDPPVLQVLVQDALEKIDPIGMIMTNIRDERFEERLTPGVSRQGSGRKVLGQAAHAKERETDESAKPDESNLDRTLAAQLAQLDESVLDNILPPLPPAHPAASGAHDRHDKKRRRKKDKKKSKRRESDSGSATPSVGAHNKVDDSPGSKFKKPARRA